MAKWPNGHMNRRVSIPAAIAAAGVVFAVALLPPAHVVLKPSPDGTIPGIIHVHTSQSDGQSPPDIVAEAAARAGLRFVIFTDHGDGTRPPALPVYRSGVL